MQHRNRFPESPNKRRTVGLSSTSSTGLRKPILSLYQNLPSEHWSSLSSVEFHMLCFFFGNSVARSEQLWMGMKIPVTSMHVPINGTTAIRFKLLSTRELSYTIMIRKFFFILSIITFLGEHGLLLGVSTLMIFTRRDLCLSITWMQPLNILRFTLPTGACTP